MKKRYEVLSFPSRYGTPWFAQTIVGAMFYACVRGLAAYGSREIRVIDREDDKLVYVL